MSSADHASIKATVLKLLDAQGPDDMRFCQAFTHPHFTISKAGLLATKSTPGTWNSALCGEYKTGRHLMTFKIHTVGNPHTDIHIGVTPIRSFDHHFGQGGTPQADAIIYHANHGGFYTKGAMHNWLTNAVVPGAMIGVLLDMTARTVTFSYNGFSNDNATRQLPAGDAFSFGISLAHPWESVEIIPSECWHKA